MMKHTIALILLSANLAHAAVIVEDKPFEIKGPTLVGYGAGLKWAAKLLPAGTYTCGNKLFGDPNYGIVKSCIGYSINTVVCGLEAGANTDAKISTSGVWLSHWCPSSNGPVLHILAGTLDGSHTAAECYAKTPGSSVDRLKACASGDVTIAPLSGIWSGEAVRIFNTRPK